MASAFPLPNYPTEGRLSRLKVDFYLVSAALALLVVGMMSLYSESASTGESWFRKQLINLAIGFVPLGIFAMVHPRVWLRVVNWLYAINIGLLTLVLVHGKHTKGSGRWIPIGSVQFQPSELTKILTILTLATFYTMRQDRITRPSTFFLGLLHVLVPTVLVLIQPHLGAALVMIVIWFAISLVAGIPVKTLGLAILATISIAGVTFSVPSLQSRFFHNYQLGRILAIFSHEKDTRGSNWQTDRAEIAFGVGGVMGTGFLQGEQKAKHYIPEQQNDFIFTVIGEEGGLIGCTLLLLSYGFFFYRVWLTMVQATEPYYKMIAGGLFAVLGFHTFVNIAMVLQLLPVVGLWLPFLSYGGTALWMCLASVGLLVAIRRRERPILFQ